jgi:aryl-alcohol dehydrogenase-like predicted oxidoreductase
VIVKEALANGRLTGRDPDLAGIGAPTDVVALAAVLHQPWVDVVLSGAATAGQLASNVRAAEVALDPEQLARLAALAEPPEEYWRHRAGLAWT